MLETVPIGLIGCGRIAEVSHLPAYRVIKKAQLVAVADVDEERAKELARKFSIKKYYSDPMNIIEREDVKAIDICLPTFLHSQFIVRAAEAGKHVFCEKPMAMSVKEADMIISKINKAGIKLMVGFNQRFEEVFKRIKEFIDKGLLGKLVSLEAKYARCGVLERYLPPSWRSDPAKGGSVLLDLACHKIDLLRWFAGQVYQVSAIEAHHLKTEAEDSAAMILKFGNDAFGVINASLVCASPFGELDLTKVYGDKGTVWYGSDNKKSIQIYLKGSLLGRTSGFTTLKMKSKKDSYVLELEAFIDSILEDRKPPITAEDAKRVLEVVEAAHQSAKTGKAIML